MNIGEESAKGNATTKQAYKLLSQDKELNFTGNIEGKDIIRGITDVVVCDGFVGNIVLKTVEGVGFSIFEILRKRLIRIGSPKLDLCYPILSIPT